MSLRAVEPSQIVSVLKRHLGAQAGGLAPAILAEDFTRLGAGSNWQLYF